MYHMCIGLLPIKKRTSLNLYNVACRSECSKELFYCGNVWRKQFFILRKVLCIVRELVAWAMTQFLWKNDIKKDPDLLSLFLVCRQIWSAFVVLSQASKQDILWFLFAYSNKKNPQNYFRFFIRKINQS